MHDRDWPASREKQTATPIYLGTITAHDAELLTGNGKRSRSYEMLEQRRNQRFELQLPLSIMRGGPEPVSYTALTRNISSGGVLFTTDAEWQIGGMIEYVVTIASVRGVDIGVRCIGKIVRFDKSSIAATLDRYQFIRRET